ncbi:MAG: hypothetical protein ACPGRZ_08195 [Alphaproteobacteria bacterium]
MVDEPPIRIDTCDADRREPGLTLFNIRPGGSADRDAPDGDIVFDLWVNGSAGDLPLSVFRAEHYPEG